MTKNQIDKNIAANNLIDKVFMGAALFALLGLAYKEVYDHVPSTGNMKYALAALPIVGVLYLIVSPMFRK